MATATVRRLRETTKELMHVELKPFEMTTSDGSFISLAGLGLVQVGRDFVSQRIACRWMEKKSGREIREILCGVLESSFRSLARKKTSMELATHWAGIGQLLDGELHPALSRLGIELIGFLPGK